MTLVQALLPRLQRYAIQAEVTTGPRGPGPLPRCASKCSNPYAYLETMLCGGPSRFADLFTDRQVRFWPEADGVGVGT